MKNTLLIAMTAATALVSSTLLAQTAASGASNTDALLKHADDYGFTHYIDIEIDGNRIEVDGYLADGWHAEAEFSATGSVLKEEKERKIVQPWGLSMDQLKSVISAAQAAGVTVVEEIDVNENGRIEVEGDDDNGRDIEHVMLYDELEK